MILYSFTRSCIKAANILCSCSTVINSRLYQYLQEKIIDMTRAVVHKNMIYDTCDSLKEKRSDATSARFHDMVICKANQIPVEGQSSGQRRKMKPKEKFVIQSACGSAREVRDSEQLMKVICIH